MKNTAAWACSTLVVLALIAALVVLQVTGADTTEFSRFVNTILNAVTPLLAGGALIRANQAATQTNGGLDARIEAASVKAVHKAMDAREAA